MKAEIRGLYWVFLASLPACYWTPVPAVMSGALFLLLTRFQEKARDKDVSHVWRKCEDLHAVMNGLTERIKGLESVKPEAGKAFRERMEKIESSLSAVNLRLGMGDFPKGIKG